MLSHTSLIGNIFSFLKDEIKTFSETKLDNLSYLIPFKTIPEDVQLTILPIVL